MAYSDPDIYANPPARPAAKKSRLRQVAQAPNEAAYGVQDQARAMMAEINHTPVSALRRAIFGLLRLGLGAFLFLSAISYSALDTTRDTAGSADTHNFLGGPGAALSNINLQFLGWAIVPLSLMIMFSGARMIFFPKKVNLAFSSHMRGARALTLFIASTFFMCLFLAAAPVPQSWPMATGLGGYVGDMLFTPLQSFLGMMNVPFSGAVIGLLAFAIGGLCLGRFFGFVTRDALLIADAAGLIWATWRVYFDRVVGSVSKWLSAKLGKAYNDEGAPVRAWVETPVDAAQQPTMMEPDSYAASHSEMDAPQQAYAPIQEVKISTPKAKRKVAAKAPPKTKSKTKVGAPRFNFPKNGKFILPGIDLLKTPPMRRMIADEGQLRKNAELLAETLSDFGVKGQIGQVSPGPVVTLYEFEPAPGVKSSRVINLSDDIARSMAAESARVAVVPGRNAIGIELPNRRRETVYLRDMLNSRTFKESEAALPMAMGEDIGGQPFIADLSKMPHLLVAGTTGSGKSVGVNAMILSLMYTLPPEQCKFIMIDPKMLELSVYDGAPHLLAPVVTEPKKAVVALKWTVREMEDRYRKMSKMGVRNMAGYNEKVAEAARTGEVMTRTVMTGYDKETGEPIYETEELNFELMPFIVVVIDEMADLMMVAGKDIEGTVQRLAQMARAAGIHMIMATQRPSVDVITGTIKANFPTRVAFRVGSKIDSRTILGEQGAEQLLGNGDMLFMGTGKPRRLHGPFVSDGEVEQIAAFVKAQGSPSYLEDITIDREAEEELAKAAENEGAETSLFDKAVAIVAADRKASTSYIQRRLGIGYNRAANLIEDMERQGMIGPSGAGGKREIFLPEASGF